LPLHVVPDVGGQREVGLAEVAADDALALLLHGADQGTDLERALGAEEEGPLREETAPRRGGGGSPAGGAARAPRSRPPSPGTQPRGRRRFLGHGGPPYLVVSLRGTRSVPPNGAGRRPSGGGRRASPPKFLRAPGSAARCLRDSSRRRPSGRARPAGTTVALAPRGRGVTPSRPPRHRSSRKGACSHEIPCRF